MVMAHARGYGAAAMRYFDGTRYDQDRGIQGDDRRRGGDVVPVPGKRTQVELLYGSPLEPAPVVQAKATGAGPATPRAPLALDSSGGAPLPEQVRHRMERLFGRDLSEVRVHAGAAAADTLSARAFARGNHVYFAPGEYDPDSPAGRQLLGHELAHVVQQRDGRVPVPGAGGMVVTDPALEQAADEAGARAARDDLEATDGVAVAPAGTAPGDAPIQRMPRRKGKKKKKGNPQPQQQPAPRGTPDTQATANPGTQDAEGQDTDDEHEELEANDNANDGEALETSGEAQAEVEVNDDEIPELVPADDAVPPAPVAPPGREQRVATARTEQGQPLTGPGLIPAGSMILQSNKPQRYVAEDLALDTGAMCPMWAAPEVVAGKIAPLLVVLRGNAWTARAKIQALEPWQASPVIAQLDPDAEQVLFTAVATLIPKPCLRACLAPPIIAKLLRQLPPNRISELLPVQVLAASSVLDVDQDAAILQRLVLHMSPDCVTACITPPIPSKLLQFWPSEWIAKLQPGQAKIIVEHLDGERDTRTLEVLGVSLSPASLQGCLSQKLFATMLPRTPAVRCAEVLEVNAVRHVMHVMALDQKAACVASTRLDLRRACLTHFETPDIIAVLAHAMVSECLDQVVPLVPDRHVVLCVRQIPATVLKHLSQKQCQLLGPYVASVIEPHLRLAEPIIKYLPLETLILIHEDAFRTLSFEILATLPETHKNFLAPLVWNGERGQVAWDAHDLQLCKGLCSILSRHGRKLLDPQNLPNGPQLREIQRTSTLKPKIQELFWLVESVMAESVQAVQVGSLKLPALIEALRRLKLNDLAAELELAAKDGSTRGKEYGADGVEYSNHLIEAVQHKQIGEEDIFSETRRLNRRGNEARKVEPLADALSDAFNQHAGLAASGFGGSVEHPLPSAHYRTIINLRFARATCPVDGSTAWNDLETILHLQLIDPRNGVVVHTVRFCWADGPITIYDRQNDGSFRRRD